MRGLSLSAQRLFPDHIAGPPQGLKGTRTGPPAFQDVMGKLAVAEIGVVDVGNFIFFAAGRFELADAAEDRRIVEINSGHSIAGARNFRLFLDPDDFSVFKHRHAETLRIRHFLEQDSRSPLLLLELLRRLPDIALDDVVSKDYADFLLSRKRFGQP